MGGHFDLGNFIRDHFASLCAIAFKITGNSEVAKDLAQDVIIKFWENQGQHKQLDSIENYLFIMIRNEALNYLRGLSREKNRHEKASLNSEQEESLWDPSSNKKPTSYFKLPLQLSPRNATESWNSPSRAKTRKRSQKPSTSP